MRTGTSEEGYCHGSVGVGDMSSSTARLPAAKPSVISHTCAEERETACCFAACSTNPTPIFCCMREECRTEAMAMYHEDTDHSNAGAESNFGVVGQSV